MNELATLPQMEFSAEQVSLIKRTIAVGASDDELALFLMQARRTGLDPFSRQIHFVKRNVWNPITQTNESKGTIQVGIDGYRLVADRTGKYAPGKANSFEYDVDNNVIAATAYVQKLVHGSWIECSAIAHMREYVQTKKDGSPTKMWSEKPHIMIGKCAEALALRRAFPAELSGVYTDEEMQQADTVATVERMQPIALPPTPTALPAPVERTESENKAAALAWLLKFGERIAFSDAEQKGIVRAAKLSGFTDDDISAAKSTAEMVKAVIVALTPTK